MVAGLSYRLAWPAWLAILLAAAVAMALPGRAVELPATPSRSAAAPAAAVVPLAFVPNKGQSDARVRYLAQGRGFSFFFTDRGLTLALDDAVLELGFTGANAHPRISAAQRA